VVSNTSNSTVLLRYKGNCVDAFVYAAGLVNTGEVPFRK